MRLVDPGTEVQAGRRRTVGTVVVSDGSREEYWFDVPAEADAGERGDSWAIALLPLAMSRGEPLEIPLPVDPILLRNLDQLQAVWRSWFPALSAVEVAAPTAPVSVMGRGVVSCFSGGVDSFFTLVRNHEQFPAGHERRITGLMLVHGADIPVDNTTAFDPLRHRYRAMAAEFGVVLLDPSTNFRSGSLGKLSWPDLTHAACLAACAASLDDIGCLMIPSGAGIRSGLVPWGSSPLTDPHFSSSRIRVEHDGAEYIRPEKIEYLSTHPAVRSQLRVCWRSKTDQNCGRCAKCIRTMAVLDAIGQLDAFSAFPRDTYSAALLARVFCRTAGEYRQLRLIHGVAVRHDREDLARPLSRALGRSDRIHVARTLVGFFEKAVGRRAALGPWLERRAISSSIID